MWPRVVRFIAGIALTSIALSVAFLAAMRYKYPPVLTMVRRFNRSVANPRTMDSAGQPGAYASVIRHVGRSTGRPYETPIGSYATDDGFVIPLPYGTTPDWLKNVQRSGSATIISEGKIIRVDRPQIVDTDAVLADIPDKDRRTLRLFKVDECLRLVRIDSEGEYQEVGATDA